MEAPLQRRTEKIGACVADPLAGGEGVDDIDTFTIPEGRRRQVYRPSRKVGAPLARCQQYVDPESA
jgi:hypothetical protein